MPSENQACHIDYYLQLHPQFAILQRKEKVWSEERVPTLARLGVNIEATFLVYSCPRDDKYHVLKGFRLCEQEVVAKMFYNAALGRAHTGGVQDDDKYKVLQAGSPFADVQQDPCELIMNARPDLGTERLQLDNFDGQRCSSMGPLDLMEVPTIALSEPHKRIVGVANKHYASRFFGCDGLAQALWNFVILNFLNLAKPVLETRVSNKAPDFHNARRVPPPQRLLSILLPGAKFPFSRLPFPRKLWNPVAVCLHRARSVQFPSKRTFSEKNARAKILEMKVDRPKNCSEM